MIPSRHMASGPPAMRFPASPAWCAIACILGCQVWDTETTKKTSDDSLASGTSQPLAKSAAAAVLPPGFRDEVVVSNLDIPVAMTFAKDGRIFVAQQKGDMVIILNNQKLDKPFFHVDVDASGERGLLGVAMDPEYPAKPYVYAYYTTPGPDVHNRVSRFTVSPTDSNQSIPGSEAIVMDLDNLTTSTNHNGGALRFGPDGMLYIATGENANPPHSQSLNTVLGKILRVRKDGTIPTDNPFYGRTSGKNRSIWAMGLRNPFTMSFGPLSHRFFINDVGQNSWEEINLGKAGLNYGWPQDEGPVSSNGFSAPFAAYSHAEGCAITAGTLYETDQSGFPAEYHGDYFFVDYCQGWLRTLDTATKVISPFGQGLYGPLALETGPDGNLYYLSAHQLRRIVYSESMAPRIVSEPQDLFISIGDSARFSVEAQCNGACQYRWLRNGQPMAEETRSALAWVPSNLSDSGAIYRVEVSDPNGSVQSREALLRITSRPTPIASILTPDSTLPFTAGTWLRFSGKGETPGSGDLPPACLTWRIDLHHETHVHPFMSQRSGNGSDSVFIPTQGEVSPHVWFRVHLLVTDSGGLTAETFRDVRPRLSEILVRTYPDSGRIYIDGTPQSAPHTFTGVTGMLRKLSAPKTLVSQGMVWVLSEWSDGGAMSHEITTPGHDTVLTATYVPVQVLDGSQGGVQVFEAEAGKKLGTLVRKGVSGFTGKGYAKFALNILSYMEWKITSNVATDTTVIVRYSNESGKEKQMKILVNGKIVAKRCLFPPARNSGGWAETTLTIPLRSGQNKLRFATTSKAAPLIDHVRME